MIYISQVDKEKLDLIDRIFISVNIEDLKEIAEKEEIVAKLKGTISSSFGFVNQLVCDHQNTIAQIQYLQNDIAVLKQDIDILVKLLNQMTSLNTSTLGYDFSNLKNRHGIY